MRDGSATRNKLNRCALDLFVTKGINATTIKDIAKKAEVAEGTLYRHYASKEELASSLFINAYEAITNHLKDISEKSSNISQQTTDIVELFCEKFDEDPVLFRYLLLTQHHQVKFLSSGPNTAHQFLVQMINQAIKKNEIPDLDPHHYAAVFMGIVLQAAVSRVYGRIERKMSEDAPLLIDAILRAIQAKG